jgi:transposase
LEKVWIVEEAFHPGVIMKDVARRFAIHESLLYRWRRLMMASATDGLSIFVPVTISLKPGMTDPLALPPPPAIVGVAWVMLEIMLPLQGVGPSGGSSRSSLQFLIHYE